MKYILYMCNVDKNEITCSYRKYILLSLNIKKNPGREVVEGIFKSHYVLIVNYVIIYRFPKLDAVDPALLYRRAQALLR